MLFYSFIYSIKIHTAKRIIRERKKNYELKQKKIHLCKFNGQS